MQHLDGDAPRMLGLPRQIDRRHPALPYWALDDIAVGQHVAGFESGRGRDGRGHGGTTRGSGRCCGVSDPIIRRGERPRKARRRAFSYHTGMTRSTTLQEREARIRALPELSGDELLRYGRHLVLPSVGPDGQRRLKAARVLLVGAGGLGSPVALYLAAAGVGTLGLVDFDVVDLSNLQRQVLHGTSDVGRSKLDSARDRIHDVNPHVAVDTYEIRLTSANALDILRDSDVVVDGTDNFATRYLTNDACVLLGKPNVYGSIFRFEGQASVFATETGPCYRCLYPDPPPAGLVPSCAEGGVLGVLPGIVGTIQATEALKLLLGIGEPLVGRLLLIDALGAQFRTVGLARDPGCPACGTREIRELIDYDQFCGAVGVAGAPGAAPEMTPRELAA